ncbi:MAG: hypothetical protein PHP50_05085 [Lachnospiraceae bacterium]|nr:hypothetical protein [Lachnospiraceae bacterium]
MRDHKVRRDKTEYGIIIAVGIVFLLLYLVGEKRASDDWYSYYVMNVIREPGYATFVRLCYNVFGDFWIDAVAIFQNILAAISVYAFSDFVYRNIWKTGLGAVLTTGLLLVPHMMTPLGSNTHLVLTDTVMAEGIALSLFFFYMIPLTRLLYEKEKIWKYVLQAHLITLLMCQFRGQMMVAIILTTLVLICRFAAGRQWKQTGLAFAAFVLVFLVNNVIGSGYNLAVNGMYTGKALGPANMVCNVLYVADREDGEAIADPALQQLFYTMYDGMKENKLLDDFAEPGIIGLESYYEACHDTINYDHFEANVQPYLEANGIDISNYTLYRVEADKTATEMMKLLLPECFGPWLVNYIVVALVGFIRTVAVVHPVLNWYTVFVYLLALVMTLVCIRQDKNSLAARFMVTVFIAICGTVFATSLMIECWARYVFYNMPFFYLGILLLCREIYRQRISGKSYG